MNTIQKTFVLTVIGLFVCTAALYSQSNGRLDELLSQNPARLDYVSYLLLSASGDISEDDSPSAAFDCAASLGLFPPDVTPESSVRIDLLSFMLMKTLDLSGGVLYRLFPGPRYAYKHLVYLGVVADSGEPARLVAGDEAVRSLGYALEFKGGTR